MSQQFNAPCLQCGYKESLQLDFRQPEPVTVEELEVLFVDPGPSTETRNRPGEVYLKHNLTNYLMLTRFNLKYLLVPT